MQYKIACIKKKNKNKNKNKKTSKQTKTKKEKWTKNIIKREFLHVFWFCFCFCFVLLYFLLIIHETHLFLNLKLPGLHNS